MSVLGDVKLNWDASHREAELLRWKKNAHRNFKANKNLWDWSEVDKENSDTIFDKLELYNTKNHFFHD